MNRKSVTIFVRFPALVFLGFGCMSSLSGADWPNALLAERFAGLALECVHKEYPNKIAHVLNSDEDVKPPRELTPAFYGCFDWHSAVHGHWLLARVARSLPNTDIGSQAKAALRQSLSRQNLVREVAYLEGTGRVSFERPYGLAWLLQLAAELREWKDSEAEQWRESLAPLERICAQRVREWVGKLTYPIRIGEHSQTAFAFGLILDWASIAGDKETLELIRSRSESLYRGDKNCPMDYEPSGHDFLSPCLAEADLMRRVLGPADYSAWLMDFLSGIPKDGSSSWLEPVEVSDPSDPNLAHLDGLNLSRAWMLEGIAAGLPAADPRRSSLLSAAGRHRDAGLAAVTGEHYEGGHWLGSFAVYLVSGRGLPQEN